MKTAEKISKVLEIKGISFTEAERLIQVSQGVLTKMRDRNGDLHKSTQEKFIRTFHVKPEWWANGIETNHWMDRANHWMEIATIWKDIS